MRYLPLTEADRAAMLAEIGAPSIDAKPFVIPGVFDNAHVILALRLQPRW